MTDELRTTNLGHGPALVTPPDERATAPPLDLAPYFFTLRDFPPAPLSLGDLFGNENPVEVEVGSGRGLFLVNAATTCPGTNFLGIEYDFKEARRAARRLQKRALPNVRILGADATIVLPKYLPDVSARALHVYFPDPWWKRRHKRRRVFNAEFLIQAARILPPGGLLHAWTDVEEYFGVMMELVAANPAFVAVLQHPWPDPKAIQK
jgi:tRNA (guanine-N7-)-methyltransferase